MGFSHKKYSIRRVSKKYKNPAAKKKMVPFMSSLV
jgi:hypothetical protein